ncbi:uncharacterized protein LOC129968447 isoform X1 [Argiope bruennichi]|uniref:Uncharacterized protein n=1 Tax=Argiope bruennichi TaxID=94029 RepID=A0A8T0FLD2_ARGBR|nr:uncharacterized protein LOC129968447 isoform X1 [Argiope bruennichi]XP_055938287.1 uncharacterized protein LOC129968447 isoform X1 [Argiope bruennichi]KAF8792017.1 hypothetical protein HNY73_003669 [Argiope bruennichi]
MELTKVSSLKEITLLNIAVSVCKKLNKCMPNTPDKTVSMFAVYHHWKFFHCGVCYNEIKEIASLLQLPTQLEHQVAALCKHVYLQMCMWNGSFVKFHSILIPDQMPRCTCLDAVDFRQYYQWKHTGVIDGKKTIEILVQDEGLNLDDHFRFVLACYFCLENDVIALWEKMPESTKRYIRLDTCVSLPLISFWLKWLDNTITNDDVMSVMRIFSRQYEVFDRILCNVSLFQYFLKNYFFNQRKLFLSSISHSLPNCPETTRFCLLEMDERDKRNLFENSGDEILLSLLDWPMQKHFMKFAHVLFPFLREKQYYSVMLGLWFKIIFKWRDFDYVGLLIEFWSQSPMYLKEDMKSGDNIHLMKYLREYLKRNYNFLDFTEDFNQFIE